MSSKRNTTEDTETVELVPTKDGGSVRQGNGSASCRNRCGPILILLMVFLGCFGGAYVAVIVASSGSSETVGFDESKNGVNVWGDEKKKHSKSTEVFHDQSEEQSNNFVSATHEKMHNIIEEYVQESGLSHAKADFLHKQNDALHKSGQFDEITDNPNHITSGLILHNTPEWVNSESKVGQIVLIGERNTGTRWVTRLLASCFPDIYVSTTLTRWKHWFQYDDGLKHPPTLVLSTFLNPYDWIDNMRLVPHDQPNHMFQDPYEKVNFSRFVEKERIDWKTFVTRPWTMPRPDRDLDYLNSTINICQYDFSFNEVNPCSLDPEVVEKRLRKGTLKAIATSKRVGNSFTDIHAQPQKAGAGVRTPCYELRRDGSGKPYDSILDMRSDKILNHLSVKEYDWVVDFLPVPFESVVEKGPWPLLRKVEDIVGVKAQCSNLPSPNRLTKEFLPKDMIQYVNENIDWETEALVGYEKREI